MFLGFKLGFGWFWGLEKPEKCVKMRQKVQKCARNVQKSALFCKKVLEKVGFLRFCASDFQSDASISYLVNRISGKQHNISHRGLREKRGKN